MIWITASVLSFISCWHYEYSHLPVYADTRCRRHTELRAKRHRPRTQQTAGKHWETPSLRRRDKDTERHRETGALVHFMHPSSCWDSWGLNFRFIDKHFECLTKWHMLEESHKLWNSSFFPSSLHSFLSSGIFYQQEKKRKGVFLFMFSPCVNGRCVNVMKK